MKEKPAIGERVRFENFEQESPSLNTVDGEWKVLLGGEVELDDERVCLMRYVLFVSLAPIEPAFTDRYIWGVGSMMKFAEKLGEFVEPRTTKCFAGGIPRVEPKGWDDEVEVLLRQICDQIPIVGVSSVNDTAGDSHAFHIGDNRFPSAIEKWILEVVVGIEHRDGLND